MIRNIRTVHSLIESQLKDENEKASTLISEQKSITTYTFYEVAGQRLDTFNNFFKESRYYPKEVLL